MQEVEFPRTAIVFFCAHLELKYCKQIWFLGIGGSLDWVVSVRIMDEVLACDRLFQ
jgi:hypothetical protein